MPRFSRISEAGISPSDKDSAKSFQNDDPDKISHGIRDILEFLNFSSISKERNVRSVRAWKGKRIVKRNHEFGF
ncbi:hypothetical protein LEP1GSC047_0125 [Leptospira inadai serovar Lyme str. 10]|uniref:Uncharacterized protein n=1 Tax=Leptospira inadai serovar Lyme str. 10 TaxID=1049790 RepID=V6HEM3_9LEPT|nr:hypothetical protein LEP1GSC047_0125 [Leptospira inadai serovar Lyme str. 10]